MPSPAGGILAGIITPEGTVVPGGGEMAVLEEVVSPRRRGPEACRP